MKRSAGTLLPISSLPSKYGIGSFGKSAREFVDFLKKAGQTYWQILPLGPTSYGDSPYQSFSSFAGNPYFIDLDELAKEGLLKRSEYQNIDWGSDPSQVDYGLLYEKRYPLLRLAVKRLYQKKEEELKAFFEEEKSWLDDYALFMAIKDSLGGKALSDWPETLKKRNHKALKEVMFQEAKTIRFYKGLQYLFFTQWKALKQYANDNGVYIIGDIPIYVAEDSVEVWVDPKQFQLDEDLRPVEIAGCPPDGFAEDGQRWGNPLYDWDFMKKDRYSWWIRRIKAQFRFYDVLRLDHFRGFAGYYAIPASESTARNGRWRQGPGYDLFKTIERKLGRLNIIVEDLGFLTEDVYELLEKCGYPGMKNMQFAFYPDNPDSEYLPHNFVKNGVVYVGTHDNEPIMGWFEYGEKSSTERAVEYLHLDKKEGYNWGMIRGAYAGTENLAVVQFQDYLGLGMEARINEPSTLGKNWKWRLEKKYLTDRLAAKIRHLAELYARI